MILLILSLRILPNFLFDMLKLGKRFRSLVLHSDNHGTYPLQLCIQLFIVYAIAITLERWGEFAHE